MNTNSTAIVLLSKYFVDRKQLFRKVIVTRASPQWFLQSQKWKHIILVSAFTIDLQQISHIVLVFPLLTLNK